MHFSQGVLGRISAVFTSLCLAACSGVPKADKGEAPATGDKIQKYSGCDPEIADRFAQRRSNIKIQNILVRADANKPAYQVQQDAKETLQKFRDHYEAIFGCKTKEAAEANALAKAVLESRGNIGLLKKIENKMVAEHWENLVVFYGVDSFIEQLREATTKMLQDLYRQTQTFDPANIAREMNSVINEMADKKHNKYVLLSLRQDLTALFQVITPKEVFDLQNEIESELGEALGRTLLEEIKKNKSQDFPLRKRVPEVPKKEALPTVDSATLAP